MRTKKASRKNKRASWQLAVQEQGHGGIRKLARGIRKLAGGIRKLEVVFGNWNSETGTSIRKLESGIRKLNFGNAKVVFGNSKMVFGNWYSETRNPDSETGSCIPIKLESDIRKLGVVFGHYFSETGTLELGNF